MTSWLCRTLELDAIVFRLLRIAGGNSITAIQILYGVRREFSIRLPATAVFEHPTVARLAAAIRGELSPENEVASKVELLAVELAALDEGTALRLLHEARDSSEVDLRADARQGVARRHASTRALLLRDRCWGLSCRERWRRSPADLGLASGQAQAKPWPEKSQRPRTCHCRANRARAQGFHAPGMMPGCRG